MEDGIYRSANNRAYYCIFHSMRAVLALENKDFKRHSGVISYFCEAYIKTKIFKTEYSKLIPDVSLIRNQSDYEDFYVASRSDTEQLVQDAETFFKEVKRYIEQLK